MSRVYLVNRFYWPDEPATGQLLTDLAERLAARGLAVTVLTSHSGDATVPRREEHAGVTIVRLGSVRSGRSGFVGKAADWGSFLAAATWRLLADLRRGDTVIAMTDPPLLGIGAWIAAAWRGARLGHWVQDIYPEIAIELTQHGWLAALRPLRDRAWRRATFCVAPGDDMAATIVARGVARENAPVVPNWGPAGLALAPADAVTAQRAAWGLADKFIVAYSGNLGRVHDLDPVLELAHLLRADPSITFLFVGGGAQRPRLEAEAARRALSNVQFRPAQPRAHLATSLGVGDAHLVTLLPGCERYVFPSKLYGIAAVGRPVIFIGPSGCEIARLVRDRDLGVAATRTDLPALADGLRTLAADSARRTRYGTAALRFAAASGGADHAAACWHELLTGAGLSRAPAHR